MSHAFRRSFCTAAPAMALVAWYAASPACAAEHWISLTTPHFEMYTTNGAKQGTEALEVFEQVRSFFLKISPTNKAADARLRIIAFKSEKEFSPYRPNDGAFAYYQRSRQRDYIVMEDIRAEHYPTAIHEYTHLIVENAGLKLPVWLNEGLADLYSSLEPKGRGAMVGRPLAGHVQVLGAFGWLDLALLTGVTPESPYYNERNKMSIFYAQSWLLTHMLALSPEYGPKFHQFVLVVAGGQSTEQAFASVYRRKLEEVGGDLRHYFRQNTVRASIFDIELPKADLDPEVRELTEFESSIALADLLASHKATAAEARRRLELLAEDQPGSPEVDESLGYLAWEEGNKPAARTHFAQAEQKGSTNPEMLYQYAMLLASTGGSRDEVIRALSKSINLKPGFDEARLALAMQLMDAKRYGSALSTLSEMRNVKPDQAFSVFSALAFCSLQLKSAKNARIWEIKALPYATSASEREQAATFLRYLDILENTVAAVPNGSQ
ncbi:MAG: hypothetical protein WB676_17325 [Bryobacteraceae bacterium]